MLTFDFRKKSTERMLRENRKYSVIRLIAKNIPLVICGCFVMLTTMPKQLILNSFIFNYLPPPNMLNISVLQALNYLAIGKE